MHGGRAQDAPQWKLWMSEANALPAAETGDILVVDDSRTNRLALQRSLEQQGHRVSLAEDGAQAIVQLHARPCDVVLLDIVMPGVDGYAVLTHMMEEPSLRHIPVIVISAVDELDAVVRCIELGAEDYLPKPFNSVLLRARLNASLRRKRLRDLEQAYLRQEVMLRQSEKLATLGRLSAGMAHELNNPIAAIQRGAQQVSDAFRGHLDAETALDKAPSTRGIAALRAYVETRSDHRLDLDPLERSDREEEIAAWLDAQGVADGWELAPDLVSMGVDTQTLDALAAGFGPGTLAAALVWIVSSGSVLDVNNEIADAAQRIAAIVKALKTYTYLDRAPVQNVDVSEGIESTLVMMRSRLRGVAIQRDYAADLPVIEAYSSELNQVWTNLIDNAASVLAGTGVLAIAARREGNHVVVKVSDSGPGIPAEVQPLIFDPFFTTKAPGEGTGLGLNISHNIVVKRHGGEITVRSQPGETVFTVRLPLRLSQSESERANA